MENIKHIAITFRNKNQLILCSTKPKFYGFKETEMYELTFGEYFQGSYLGNHPDEENQCHYMAMNTEYFPLDRAEEALAALLMRAKSDEPFKASNLGYRLEQFCEKEER